MKLDNYRQKIEGELLAMIFALIALFTVGLGFVWAVVFALKWVLR